MPHQTAPRAMTEMMKTAKKLGLLYLAKGRLKAAEKMTVFLSSLALALVLVPLGLLCLIFISISLGRLLANSFEPYIAFLFVSAFYLLVIVVIVVFRRRLFVDPIARFMSRLLIEKPYDDSDTESVDSDNADDAQHTDQQYNVDPEHPES